MPKDKSKKQTLAPIVCTLDEGYIQILFEGMKPYEFHRPQVSKEAEKEHEGVKAFDELMALAVNEEWVSILESIRPNNDLGSLVKDDMAVEGLTIKNGRISFMGFRVKNSLADKIISLLADANRRQDKADKIKEIKPLIILLSKVLQNSDNRVVDRLFDFVDENNILINPKTQRMVTLYVNVDKDCKNGRHDLSKGEWSMPRNMVSESTALNVFTSACIRKPGGDGKVLRVEVDPSDVVLVGLSQLTVCKLVVCEETKDESWYD
jgi:hypothetical protein